MSQWYRRLTQRRSLDLGYLQHSEWLRCVGAFDMTALSAASSFAPCIFVFVPQAVKYIAGPSTTIGVILAFVVAFITGFHYVELAHMFPKSGSSYTYSYVVFGEFVAFLTGWSMIVDYHLVTTIIAKEWSAHMNFLFNSSIHPLFHYNSQAKNAFWVFDSSPDYFAMIGILVGTLLCFLGIRVMSVIFLVLEIVCCLVLLSLLLIGFFYTNTRNWIEPGFFPAGPSGITGAASKVLLGFIGMEVITIFIEEALNPKKHFHTVIPTINVISFVCYFFISVVITLIVPTSRFPATVMLPTVYGIISVPASRFVLTVGSVCGLSAAVSALLLPASRISYAMGQDRLICPVFTYTTKATGTPTLSLAAGAIFSAGFVCFNSSFLADIPTVTIPTRFLLVCLCALMGRYQPRRDCGLNLADYSHFQTNRKVFSYSNLNASGSLATDGSVTANADRNEDETSLSSSLVLRNIIAASIESLTQVQPDATFLEDGKIRLTTPNGRQMVTSASKYAEIGLDSSPTDHPHNCLRSPCLSPKENHLYQRDTTEAPGFAISCAPNDMERSLIASPTPNQAYLRAQIYIGLFITTSLVAFLIGFNGGLTLKNRNWYTISTLLFFLLCSLLLAILIVRLPQKSPSTSGRIPASPYISLVAIFLLLLIISSSSSEAWLKFLVIAATGSIVYFAYGYRQSRETYRQRGVNLSVTNREKNEEVKAIIENQFAD